MKKKLLLMIIIMTFCMVMCSCEEKPTTYWDEFGGSDLNIWYECANTSQYSSEITENTNVYFIRVTQNGIQKEYCVKGEKSIGYFAKLSDEEILKELETNKNDYIYSGKEEEMELRIFTDSDKETVKYETVPFFCINQTGDENTFMYLVNVNEPVSTSIRNTPFRGFKIYLCEEYEFGGFQLQKCEEDAPALTPDSVDCEGAIVDGGTPLEIRESLNK